MLFNSYIFIFVFLPLTLLLYYGLNYCGRVRTAKAVLILMSVWFYAYFHWNYVFILLASIAVNYGLTKWMKKNRNPVFGRTLLVAGIIVNLGIIFYYKYLDFVFENLNHFFKISFSGFDILMPLGISFFTFQQISYLVDSYRGTAEDYGFLDYALFVTFFPQLVAGPIVTQEEMMPQFADTERKKFSHGEMARGIYLFAVGLFKKVILADTLGGR